MSEEEKDKKDPSKEREEPQEQRRQQTHCFVCGARLKPGIVHDCPGMTRAETPYFR